MTRPLSSPEEQLVISVVICTFNRPKQLRQTLEALSRQTLSAERFEVLIVNNGTIPETELSCRPYLDRYPNWRLLRQPKPGAAAARNLGVDESRALIVLFLDDDTVADPVLLSKHLESHQSRRGCAILGAVRFPWTKAWTPWQCALVKHSELFQSFDFPDPSRVPFNHFYTCNLSMPRDFFETNLPFDEGFTSSGFEDIELGYRFVAAGNRIVYNPAASALHDVKTSFRDFARKRRDSGLWLHRLLELHPGAQGMFLRRQAKWRQMLDGALGWAAGLFTPLYDLALPFPLNVLMGELCWRHWQRTFWMGYESGKMQSKRA